MSLLERPIVVVGAARSGTTVLSAVVASHPDICGWPEPGYVWLTGNAHLGHDMIPAERAAAVRKRIRSKFESFQRSVGKPRLLEKTPANALRLPFVLQVLPDAKVVHIVRDGRDVTLSARDRWEGRRSSTDREPPGRTLARLAARRIRTREIPLRDLPWHLPRAARTALTRLGWRRGSWGPRFPGIRQVARDYPALEACALQWRFSVECILNSLEARRGRVDALEVRYEELCSRAAETLERIFDFVEVPVPDNIGELAARVRPHSVGRWKTCPQAELDRMMIHLSHTLRSLGYDGPAA